MANKPGVSDHRGHEMIRMDVKGRYWGGVLSTGELRVGYRWAARGPRMEYGQWVSNGRAPGRLRLGDERATGGLWVCYG